MEELIKQVAARSGISEDQARTAVTTVIGFIKGRLPEPFAGQLDGFIGGGGAAEGESGGAGDIASKVGGMLGL